jgi:hypothetical protein
VTIIQWYFGGWQHLSVVAVWTYRVVHHVSILQQVRRDVRRDPVVVRKRLFDEPRCVQVRFTVERVLKERPDVHLAIHFAVAANVVFIDKCFVSGWVVQANEIPSKGIALNGSIRTPDHGEFGLFANGARGDVAIHESDQDLLAREKLAFELVVDPVDCEGNCQ